jgi:hypothetical protein
MHESKASKHRFMALANSAAQRQIWRFDKRAAEGYPQQTAKPVELWTSAHRGPYSKKHTMGT